MQINPYVIFDGQCREAFSTYAQCLGGTVSFSTYGEMPGGVQQPGQSPDRIMHARLEAHGAVLLGSDGPGGEAAKDAVWVSLTLHDTAEAERIYAALTEGGQAVMPLAETFWAPRFGMLKDRFGVSWMINCERPA